MYKMIVVDDEYLVRTGITETINWEEYGISVVATATNGAEGLQKIAQFQPDIIISDIKMPILDGVGLVSALYNQGYDGTVIILSGYNDFEYAKSTLEKGVFKYLLKPISNDELAQVVLQAVDRLKKKRKTNLYMTDFSVGLPIIKQQLVNSIFYGEVTDSHDLQDKMSLYDLPVLNRGVIVYCSADLNSAGNDAYADQNVRNALAIVEQKVLELLEGSNVFHSVTDKRVAFATDFTDVDALEKAMIGMLGQYEKQCKVLMSIGISGVFETFDSISSSFGVAKFIATNKLYVTLNSVSVQRGEGVNKMYKKHIVDALKYIADNYSNNQLKIKTVADSLYVSESYLMHLFKQELNKTFNSCLTEYRVMMAKRLLREQKYRVYEIAEMVGYLDMKYFGQVFRRAEGCTPSEYVRLYNEKKS